MKHTLTVDLFRQIIVLKSVRVHFAPGKTPISLELLGQFLRFLPLLPGAK